ncbi:MAG: hypothetical protein K2J44_08335, partial [Ruminococcus sp.]|nr:hypothetical protein [Ruminococcus sp.]
GLVYMNETEKELEKRIDYLEECILEEKPVGATRQMTKTDYITAGIITAVFFIIVIGGAFL